jgi:hypothetical protein
VFGRTWPLCCCLLLSSCGSPPRPILSKGTAPQTVGAESGKQALGALLPAYELARVEPGTYGPISVSLDAGLLSVWASPGTKQRTWHARAIDRDGRATTAQQVIGKTSLELGLVTLAAVSQGLRSLLVFSTQLSEQSTQLQALLLDASGAPKSPVVDLVTLGSPLLWTQVVDTGPGPMVLYAITREDHAEVRALGLTPDGTLRFADREVAAGLRAWQVVAAPDGAALAVVRATSQGRGGTVSLLLLDHAGVLTRGPIDLDDRGTAELDLDLTRIGRNYVLAWSDRRRIDSRILVAAVDPVGTIVVPARPALPAVGEQTLVKIVAPVKGGLGVLVWENPALPFSRRRLSLAEVDENANVGKKVVHLACSSRSSTLPEIVTTDDGIRVLTLDDLASPSGAEAAEPMPTYVELGPGLVPRAAVPLTLSGGKGTPSIPLLAWGLDCRHGCRAMAALDDSPVTIATIPLSDAAERPKASERVRQLVLTDAAPRPSLERLDSIAEVEPLADLAVARKHDGFLMATLTYFDPTTPLKRLTKPGPDGRTDPLQARVDIFPVGSDGEAHAAQTISYRATCLPGLSIAAGKPESIGHGVAWSAIDQGQPQLFLSLLNDDAKKRSQRMLTHKKGRLDEISLVAVDDGWLLGWVDERTNGLELYASRITKNLERRGVEQRLTNQPGDLSALALVPMRDEAIVVYVASRKTPHKRGIELFTRRISLADAQPLDVEHRILELSGAVKFLNVAGYADGILLGWLEIPTDSGPTDSMAKLRLLGLDAKGMAVSQPSSLPLTDAVPAALAIECPNNTCHGIAVADVGGRGELQGFSFDPRSNVTPKLVPLARSLGTVEQNVAPVLVGEHVFMVDQVDAERARIVHAKLVWD